MLSDRAEEKDETLAVRLMPDPPAIPPASVTTPGVFARAAKSLLPVVRGKGPLAKVGILDGVSWAIADADRFCRVESPSTAEAVRVGWPIGVVVLARPIPSDCILVRPVEVRVGM